jgi:hypothetical protein
MASSIVAVTIEAARMVKSFVIIFSNGWPRDGRSEPKQTTVMAVSLGNLIKNPSNLRDKQSQVTFNDRRDKDARTGRSRATGRHHHARTCEQTRYRKRTQ